MEELDRVLELAQRVAIILGVAAALAWGWIEYKARKVFISKDELDGFGKRLNKFDKEVAEYKRLATSNERAISEMRLQDQHMIERFTNEVVRPLRQMTDDLRQISKTLNVHGEAISSQSAVQKAQNEMLREIRRQVEEMRRGR